MVTDSRVFRLAQPRFGSSRRSSNCFTILPRPQVRFTFKLAKFSMPAFKQWPCPGRKPRAPRPRPGLALEA
eukprot:14349939-Alexandrium_andersonii.AAC.1